MADSIHRDGQLVERVQGNLPSEVSSFVGREAELRQLVELQPRARLLTLLGPGGVGKTRLAMRLAAARRPAFPSGVWLMDVAPLAEPELVPRRYAEMLGIGPRDGRAWHEALPAELRERRLLTILDTCELQIAACAELVATLLAAAPGVQILATSRQPLGLTEELIWHVPSLSVPEVGVSDRQRVQASEACLLLAARVTDHIPGFSLTDQNTPFVAQICQRLAGMPLAIELIATHVATFGLQELAERLDARLALDLTGHRGGPVRQLSLRATLKWSYDLLSPAEQTLLRRAAVFVGSWTLAAADAVCAGGDPELFPIQGLLDSLFRKSLVLHSTDAEGIRYRLLDVTHQFALDLLDATGESEQVHRRHLDWYLALAEQVPPEALDREHADRLEHEHDDLRAALTWAQARGEVTIGLRIATAAFPLWFFRSYYAEGRDWLERFLASPRETVRAEVSLAARAWRSQLMMLQGELIGAEGELQTLVAEQRARADVAGLAVALVLLANVALWRGALDTARRLYGQALLQLAGLDNPILDHAQFQSAFLAWQFGDVDIAADLTARSDQHGRATDRWVFLGRALWLRALIAAEAGKWRGALKLLDRAETVQRRVGEQHGLIDSLIERGHVLLGAGQTNNAHVAFASAARLAYMAGARNRLVRAIEGQSRMLAGPHPEISVQLAAAAAESRSAMGSVPWPRDRARLEASLAAARTSLGSAAYTRAQRKGASLLESEAVDLATSTPGADGAGTLEYGLATLTRREQEVLEMFAAGATTRQIGEQLVISRATARTHLEHVMAKLGLHSRVELAKLAAQPWSLRPDSQG